MWTLAQKESGEWVKGYMEEEKRISKRENVGENVEVAGRDPGSVVGGQWNKASELSKTALTGNFERKWLHWTELISVCSFSDWGEIQDGMATHCTRTGHTTRLVLTLLYLEFMTYQIILWNEYFTKYLSYSSDLNL